MSDREDDIKRAERFFHQDHLTLKVCTYLIMMIATMAVTYICFYSTFKPYQETKSLWLPAEYHIANLVDGQYTIIAEVRPSGTLNYISMADYQNRFAGKKSEIIIDRHGQAFYLHKTDSATFITRQNLLPFSFFSFTDQSITDITGQGQIQIDHKRLPDFFGMVTVLSLVFAVLAVGFVALIFRFVIHRAAVRQVD